MIMDNVKLNKNLAGVKCSATLAINEKIKALRANGHNVVHFGFGESPFEVPSQIREKLIDAAQYKHYLPGVGLAELRQAVATYYQQQFDYRVNEDDVFIAPGSKEAIFQLLYLLDGPLLLPAPSWVSYEPQARLLQKPVVFIQTQFEQGYCLQAEQLQKVCQRLDKSSQKILLLNSPNNPTGMVYPQSTLNALATVCQENNIIIISDEIYAGIEFGDMTHSSMRYAYPEKTIVTSGLSKLFSAGGYRLGFAVIPSSMPELKQGLIKLISETYSCVSTPISYAGVAAYKDYESIKPYLSACNQRHLWASEILSKGFNKIGLRCHAGQGAFYLMPDFSPFKSKLKVRGIETDVQLCDALLNEVQVAALPGSEFGMPPQDLSMRIAIVDYIGEQAFKAKDPEDACFDQLRLGLERINQFTRQ